MDEKIKRLNWLAKHGYDKDFDNKLAAKNYSINTRNTILIFGKCFEKEVEKSYLVAGADGIAIALDESMVEQFLIKHTDPLNRWALKKYFSLKGFKQNLIPKIAGRAKQRLPKWIYREEVYSIANALVLKDNIICRLLFEGGMRVSEVRNLRTLNFNFNDKIIRFVGKGNKERIVRFTEETKILITNYISQLSKTNNDFYDHSLIFKARSREHITRIIKQEAIKQLGRSISAHTLRHSCATHLLANGMNLRMIQEYLGHASINTTTIYTHITRGDLDKKWIEVMEREPAEPKILEPVEEVESKEVIDVQTEKLKGIIQNTFI